MPSIIDSFKNMSDLQTQGLEPIRNLSVFAVDAFEKMARQNYAFYGDVLEFVVAQAKLPINAAEPKDLLESQIASGKEFVELLTNRTNEFVELGNSIKDTSAKLFEKDIVEPAKKAVQAATKKAA